MLGTLAHTAGWPVPVGGTQVIADALIADLRAHGGELVLGEPVTAPPDGVAIYDTAPPALLNIYGDAVPDRYAKALRRYRFGPGVCKIDFVLSGEIPWRDARVGQSPTVHMGGTRAQMALCEREIAAGRHAARPMTLAVAAAPVRPVAHRRPGSPTVVDLRPCPSGFHRRPHRDDHGDVRRCRPGFRDLVVSSRCVPAAQMAQHNANYVGGDITVGGATLFAAMVGPTLRLNPWSTPIPKAYLCSSATPPGTGVHGMAGYYAARTVLRKEFGIKQLPRLSP